MANEEHLAILKSGVSAWNKWRSERREIVPDLSGTNLITANLSGANLRGGNLRGADLRGANLDEAILSQANLEGANLNGANLSEADLVTADLSGADLSVADLDGADLREADLSEANLRQAHMIWADLDRATVRGADLGDSVIGYGSFADVDLSAVKGLETVTHFGPSSIGIDTIYRSKGKIPKVFLERAGVPEKFILYMDSLVWEGFEFYSCFISYSAKEKDFARRLYKDLKGREVRCWLFPEDAKWGEPVWGEIDRATKRYDRLVVLCSERSLQSKPVLREIERALQREDRENKNVLFPVRLDDYLFEKWEHPRKADVVSKVVGDFRGCEDQKAYGKAFGRLVLALNRSQNNRGA